MAGREHAKIGDRLYSHHVVDRMQPSGIRYSSQKDVQVRASKILQVGQKDYGRSISPTFVEETLTNGNLIDKQIVNGVEREVWSSGTIEVVTEQNGKIIITVMTK
ncbi:hypothetical protein [Aneurinibacillus migulanus]|uniref:hypothetical protein n=1 Tax=Aneurinibacillus migulanus TaxID=47500 RepID=UPI0006970C5F|nr:hypothetical protein [Aneurinibacillus migulanus]